MAKAQLNLIGARVRQWRRKKGWSQADLAAKLQLRGWSTSRDSLASLELQRRRVSDCELLYLARVLGVRLDKLFPSKLPMRQLGARFQGGQRLSLFPMRGEP